MMLISEIFTNPSDEGIFTTLHKLYPTLTFITDDNQHILDVDYIYNHSGDKLASKLLIAFSDKLELIASVLFNRYSTNWLDIYNAYQKEYNPIENYSMVENEKINSSIKTTNSMNNGTYGFNSNNAVNDATSESTAITSGNADDNNRVLTRNGNIGVTTSQELLKSELDLRTYDFINVVMSDIDKVLALHIY